GNREKLVRACARICFPEPRRHHDLPGLAETRAARSRRWIAPCPRPWIQYPALVDLAESSRSVLFGPRPAQSSRCRYFGDKHLLVAAAGAGFVARQNLCSCWPVSERTDAPIPRGSTVTGALNRSSRGDQG